jgi:hypothetical protein
MEMLYGPMVGIDIGVWVAVFRDCDLDHTYDFRVVHLGEFVPNYCLRLEDYSRATSWEVALVAL